MGVEDTLQHVTALRRYARRLTGDGGGVLLRPGGRDAGSAGGAGEGLAPARWPPAPRRGLAARAGHDKDTRGRRVTHVATAFGPDHKARPRDISFRSFRDGPIESSCRIEGPCGCAPSARRPPREVTALARARCTGGWRAME